jgi:uncharacterized membrane protein
MSVFFFLTFLVALGGMGLAGYIYKTKARQENLVCPLDGHCDAVVQSQYSKFIGVPVELMGVAYYGVTALLYILFVLSVVPYTPFFSLVMVLLGLSGGLFSVYLVSIQAFVLKQWCTWCIGSAFLSLLIMLLSFFGSGLSFVPILVEYKALVVILHALVAALGVGGALITDVFFFKFLKDYRIANDESETLKTFSQIMWAALTGLIVTGAALFLTNVDGYLASSKFITKMIAVLVIGVNGGVLNLLISPRIQEITFGGKHVHHEGELARLRKFAFATGAISISSWILVFILGSLRSIPYTAGQGIGLYVVVVTIAVLGSQVYAKILSKKA